MTAGGLPSTGGGRRPGGLLKRSLAGLRHWALHLGRWGLLIGTVWLIHDQHARRQTPLERGLPIPFLELKARLPQISGLGKGDTRRTALTLLGADGKPLGYALQTLPAADRVIGYSGPSNVLLVFDGEDRILDIQLVTSGDTAKHVQAVREDPRFLGSYRGLSWKEAAARSEVDGVSGATLTSLAVAEAIAVRLGGEAPSFRFPRPVRTGEARRFFPETKKLLRPDSDEPAGSLSAEVEAMSRAEHGGLPVLDAEGRGLGWILRTSPEADSLVGYQGPTDVLLAVDRERRVVDLRIRDSYETPKYLEYVREDEYFWNLFRGKTLGELANWDEQARPIEGVSGATMTSRSIAEGLIRRAGRQLGNAEEVRRGGLAWSARDAGTAVVVGLALLIHFTNLRGIRWLRLGFQLVLVGYLGFYQGDLLSQAILVGWAQHGVPWQFAGGLLLIAAVSLSVPLLTRRQVYCHQLCPHGAAQQLVYELAGRRLVAAGRSGRARGRVGRLLRRWVGRLFRLLPAGLLAVVILVAMGRWQLDLVDLEAFDAYLIPVAGWASLGIAVGGLLISLLVPMGYCRYGCPTGSLLNYLRRSSQSGRFNGRDAVAAALFLLALGLWWGAPASPASPASPAASAGAAQGPRSSAAGGNLPPPIPVRQQG